MAIPGPRNGAVLRYAYLWKSEQDAGRVESEKDRPALVIVALRAPESGVETVYVLPITHGSPQRPQWAVEIHADEMARLGLYEERSWIICDEINRFLWPGYNLRPVPGSRPPRWQYGVVLRGTYEKARHLFLKCRNEMRARVADRK